MWWWLLSCLLLVVGVESSSPNILFILVDDFGWNNVGYHRKRLVNDTKFGDPEVKTPNLDNLAKSGIELDRHYTYNFCSPTRSSLQSGRLPVHVVVDNIDPISINPNDTVAGYSGIPPAMTGLAQRLKEAGYKTHMTGKWDCGMAHVDQTPMGRGYDTFFGYYHHANDYYNERLTGGSTVHLDLCGKRGVDLVDLWDTDGPATKYNGTDYEEYLFTENTLKVIDQHDTAHPLFLFHAFHIVHTPLQIPAIHEKSFSFLRNKDRRLYASMVEYMDESVGRFVAALQRKGMWDNTLLVLSSDNGGPIYGSIVAATGITHAFGGANNLPLRGGKTSDWEGGIRTNALVSGGAVPLKMRGTVVDSFIHICDWYGTIVEGILGMDPHDKSAEKAGLPPIDSVNQWPLLTGQVGVSDGPRKEIHISRKTLIQGRYKLLTGNDRAIFDIFPEEFMTFDTHAVGWGPVALKNLLTPGRKCQDGCLFDIYADPNEDSQITDKPEVVQKMMQRLEELNKSNFNPNRGEQSGLACKVAQEKYNGFYGPFLGLNDPKYESPFVLHEQLAMTKDEQQSLLQNQTVLRQIALFRS